VVNSDGGGSEGPGRPPKATTGPKELSQFGPEAPSESAKKGRSYEAQDTATKKPDIAEQVVHLKDLVPKMLPQQKFHA